MIYCPNFACPGAAARGTRPLRVARGDGHSRPLVRAHRTAHRGGVHRGRRRPLPVTRRAARRARWLRGEERRAAGRGDRCVEDAAAFAFAVRPRDRHVGATAAELLARHFGDLPAIAGASVDDILAIRGIGEMIAVAVTSFFADPSARKLVKRLAAAGVELHRAEEIVAGGAFKGLTIVITGTLPTLSRRPATELIEANGGRVTSGVSKSTDFVVVGEDAGSKLEKARALGVEMIDEAELLRRIGACPRRQQADGALDRLVGNAMVALTRETLVALRAALLRENGTQAAMHLQNAGYAGARRCSTPSRTG